MMEATRSERYVSDWFALLAMCMAGASEAGAEIRRLGNVYRRLAQDEQGEAAQAINERLRNE